LSRQQESSPRSRHNRLSVRLVGLFLLTGLALVVLIATTVGGIWRDQYRHAVQPHLELYVNYLLRDLGDPPDPRAAQALADRLPVEIMIDGPEVEWSSTPERIERDEVDIFHARRVGRVRIEFGEYGHDRLLIRSQVSEHRVTFLLEEREGRRRGAWGLGLLILLVLGVLAACYHGMRWLLKPIGQLDAGVQRIGAGELDHRIQIKRRDELGALAESVNAMAEDLQHMLEAKRQLLLAISHELRSPLTRLKVTTALLEESPRVEDVQRDIDEMERLITELLEAERLNTRHAPLNPEWLGLDELVHEFVAEENVEDQLEVNITPGLGKVQADPIRLKLLLRNLVGNALRHNRPDIGPVILSVEPDGQSLLLRVADHGPGMNADEVSRAAEPFWRPDSSRQRGTGGFGLGLYLCLKIAEAHGGSMEIYNEEGSGTRVQVSLPVEQDTRPAYS